MINTIFVVFAKSNFNNIKSEMLRGKPKGSQVIFTDTVKGTLFVRIDRIKTRDRGVFLPGFDFDKNEDFTVLGDDINFVFEVTPVTGEKSVVIFFKKLASDIFAELADFLSRREVRGRGLNAEK